MKIENIDFVHNKLNAPRRREKYKKKAHVFNIIIIIILIKIL